MIKFVVLLVVLLFIKNCLCQIQMNYTWPGPISVPEGHLVVTPPNSVFIQLSNDGTTKRELKVREDVDSIVDCSLVLDTIGITNTTQLTWYLRKFRANQVWDPFESVVLETVDPEPDLPSYAFSGDFNERLIIRRSTMIQIAREGNAGDYRCEVCETSSESSKCLSGNFTLSVIAYPPVIYRGGLPYAENSHYVGGSLCVLPNDPLLVVVTCIHNTSHPTTQEPPMMADWTQNGGPLNINVYSENNGIILGGDLIIFTDQDFQSILGVYTCILRNSEGNDTASTEISKCCEDGDIPVIGNSSGFVEVPPNHGIVIGQTTCLSDTRTDPIVISCPLSSTPQYHERTYTWSKDGVVLDYDTSSINVTVGGQYTCSASTECGEDRHLSQIIDVPKISSISGSIQGVVGDGCSRTGSPTVPSSLCPKPLEQFTISCDSVTSYTITGPGGTVSDNSLVIDSASVGNVGTYTCSSSNLCNSASSQITVTLGQENGNWRVSEWSQCSEQCGNGIHTRTVSCVGTGTGNQLSEDLCDSATRQPSSETCNEGPCESPVWVEGDWTNCSKKCGKGKKTRQVTCQMPSTQEVVNDSTCTGSRPQSTAYCNMSPCCTTDLYPAQCSFIAGTDMCNSQLYQDVCCCTCASHASLTS